VVVSVDNAIDGNTYVYCSDFSGLVVRLGDDSLPYKAWSTTSEAPASCTTGGSPSAAFLD
jgi:hypothetical protein